MITRPRQYRWRLTQRLNEAEVMTRQLLAGELPTDLREALTQRLAEVPQQWTNLENGDLQEVRRWVDDWSKQTLMEVLRRTAAPAYAEFAERPRARARAKRGPAVPKPGGRDPRHMNDYQSNRTPADVAGTA